MVGNGVDRCEMVCNGMEMCGIMGNGVFTWCETVWNVVEWWRMARNG